MSLLRRSSCVNSRGEGRSRSGREPGTGLRPLTRDEMEKCLAVLREDFGHGELLSRQQNRAVVRIPHPVDTGTVVVKLWARPEPTATVRRLLRIAPSDWEWRNLRHLHRLGAPVPQPLGRCRALPTVQGFTEAVFMEDVGDCEHATNFLKRLIAEGDESGVERFEDALIGMIESMLAAGVIDTDYGMANVAVRPDGRPVRLDLELARRVFCPRLPVFGAMYGEMIGRMIGFHAFAVQPDTARTTRFAERLRARINPSPRVLREASAFAQKMMRYQLRMDRIDTRLWLPWDP